jgi:cob(I)alamin adenosyltransferase
MEQSMSIATKRGDTGQTSLVGNERVSKGSARVEAYGDVDELNSTMGFARSICDDAELRDLTKSIQRELFAVGSALATREETNDITQAMLDRLTDEVHRIEAIEGVIGDWTIPGEHAAAAAFDLARTVCRRAERAVIRLSESEPVAANAIAYLNRLSDLLWLCGRLLEVRAGVDSRLRGPDDSGRRWSRAW